MELVSILQVLWRRRLLAVLGVLLAAVIVMLAPGRHEVGLAEARVLIDTPDSHIVHAAPEGADTLTTRAALLGNLLAAPAGRARIAREAGLPARRLDVIAPNVALPTLPGRLPDRSAEAAAASRAPYVLRIGLDRTLPSVSLHAEAPNAAGARSVAAAAMAALESAASAGADSPATSFALEPLAPPQARLLVSGPEPAMAVAGAAAAFGLWCALLVLAFGPRSPLGRARHRAGLA